MVSNKQIIKCNTRVVIFSKRRMRGGAELEVAGGELAGLKRFIWSALRIEGAIETLREAVAV